MLLAKGADIEVASPKDVLNGWGQLGFPAGSRSLHAAASRASLDATRALLDAGANPNAQDARGSTPLMAACMAREAGQRLAVVLQLLESGAHPTVTNAEGFTPVHFSAAVGDTDALDALIARAPAVVTATNSAGTTPLSLAVSRGQESAVACLLRHGAGDNRTLRRQQNNDLTSDLVTAVDRGQENIVRLLVGAGPPSPLDVRQAVYAGVWHRRPRIVHALLAAEEKNWSRILVANYTVKGLPMLHLAAASGSLAMVRVLMWAGALETIADVSGERAAEVIGLDTPPWERRDPDTETAISRALERGPAFRAQSLAWERIGCGHDSRLPGTEIESIPPPYGVLPPVRVFRPRRGTSLVRVFCR